MVLPVTVHPAFEKAAHYFSVKPLHIPLTADYRADIDSLRAAIGDNTVLAVGSAPCYPYGVIDPIPEMATLAAERGVAFHVDACLGGFMLPFLRRLGYSIPPFDFSVPGVTSMSADVHKYGYAAKGASVVLYRNKEIRRHQFFSYADWPGGLYGSPTMTGTRPGGAIAAAWAALRYLGEDGYLRLARTAMDATKRLIDGINAVPGLVVRGEPQMSVFAFGSDSLDIYAVGDALDARGWRADRLQLPPNLHLMVTATHEHVVAAFLTDLAEATRSVATSGAASATTAAYSQTE
jgi:glutamate/tyrosine decarboxylase-like PLP-dependent enzyme